MALQLIPALMLFAFVINIGMLVFAKINLQNAADTAAYTGAAAQARLLNRISHLNYQLRMNYKKFLFNYYVMGNMHLKCFPGNSTSSAPECQLAANDPFHFQNRRASGGANPEFPSVPSVCFPAPDGTNVCKLDSTSASRITDTLRNPAGIPGSPEFEAMRAQLARIARITEWDCAAKGAVNSSLAFGWLYNTDPTGTAAVSTIDHTKFLIQDIGLVPANILVRSRIKTLQGYVNAAAQQNVNQTQIQQFSTAQELAAYERTVLAYRSAEGTLSAGTDGETNWGAFEAGSLTLSELLPSGGPGGESPLLNLADIRMPAFNVFYTYSGQNAPLGNGYTGDGGTDGCASKLGIIPVPENLLPVGVYKSTVDGRSTRVYYAVKLQAKAHLLFNPFDDLTLTAYAAAAPYGSRIGPYIGDTSIFVRQYRIPDNYIGSERPLQNYAVPTYPFSDDGSVTMNHQGFLRSFLTYMGGNEQSARTVAQYERGLRAALGPDPWEVGRYNIPVEYTSKYDSVVGNGFNKYFNQNGYYHFWAPLIPIDNSRNNDESPAEQIISAVGTFTGTTTVSATNEVRVQILNAVQTGLTQYMASLSRPQIEQASQETSRVATMPNPLAALQDMGAIGVDDQRKITDPELLSTSYAGSNLLVNPIRSREGYSVKIVAFPTVIQGGGTSRTANIGNPEVDVPWAAVSAENQAAEEGINLPLIKY